MTLQKPNISFVFAEYLCHSCGACFVSCSHGSISFKETVGGYLFPKINTELCTCCGLCYKVCPGVHFNKSLIAQMPEDPFVGNILSCHVGKAMHEEIFKNSQSGGVATALLAYLLDSRQISAAIVTTMQTATPPRGQVLVATSVDDLIAAQKSKYVPIPLLSAISYIKKLEGSVAFVGLSCHMHGLNNLIDLYPELKAKISIKIGLVCDRIQTNAAVDFLGQKATDNPIKHLVFRDKQRPSYPGNTVVELENGEEIVLDASLRMWIKDFFTPARCRLCFDKLNVFADVVLGDPHGLKGVNRAKGETLIFVRSLNGEQLLFAAESAGSIKTRKTDLQAAIKGQGIREKRKQWSSYIQAWSELGKCMPKYSKQVFNSASFTDNNTNRYKDSLLQSIGLDTFNSRSEVLRAADKWLLKRRVMLAVLWPFDKAIRIASKIIKTIGGFAHDS